ncbi:MAG TPA: HAD family hydrolase [Candidatus Acidoferrales bacterium]|jgi:sugar-phosphatase|nr:HAD family hydrolase [Candidatus Acidoferrales bacterium]
MAFAYDAVLFDLYGTLVDDVGKPAAGVHALLASLAGARWGVVTSCPRKLAERLLSLGAIDVPLLVGADDVAANKPAPDGYLLAAKRLAVEPEKTLVIEDSVAGITAGRAAGMDVVAILRGRAPEMAHAATFSVKDLAALQLIVTDGEIQLEGV